MSKCETLLGVRWEIEHYSIDGFQLTLTNEETEEILYDRRMVGYTEFEALWQAIAEVFEDTLQKHGDDAYEVTLRIAEQLNVEELYEEEN